MALIIIIGGIVLIILLVIGLIVSLSSERTLVEDRLNQYLGDDKQSVEKEAQRSALTDWVSKRVERTSLGDRISRDLARADMKFKVGEYIALIFISTVAVGGLTYFIGGRLFLSFVIGAAIGFWLPGFYMNRQKAKRLNKFNDQLSDMINLMVNGIRAGYSTMQAMEAISKELPPPISDEFRRVVQEMQIGIPMETALENLLRRIPSDDLDFMITAINVQREVGGNLSEILDTISFTIRERVKIKGEIRVLTATVRASGTLLALIPVFLTVILWFLNPKYLLSFMDAGLACAIGAAIFVSFLIGLGYFVMMRISDIEV
ncbi:MAG: type II secretion system F family protein [Chloroflexi bacterium]|nr:type II secretion system F family protein [Chloroflexota bacterium]MBI1856132.1 type II secretion system F family protein [Chloroflexota bacterium]MBI3341041.1 type II secretion system F family protein [Chloroflexota bacterium]